MLKTLFWLNAFFCVANLIAFAVTFSALNLITFIFNGAIAYYISHSYHAANREFPR
jgi:hypothetical protein